MKTPDQTGKTFVITGANTGIGRVTALELARAGAEVWLLCRSKERTAPLIESISRETSKEPRFLELDLADLESVRRCAGELVESEVPIHGLINNAGVAGKGGETKDGFELIFGVNHLGHFLLTRLLLDRLVASAPARVVTVASKVHHRCKSVDWTAFRGRSRTVTTLDEYGASKLANILFSRELGRRLRGTGVTTYSLHPGVVASDIWRSVPWPIRPLMKLRMSSNEEGAQTSLYCATAPQLQDETGLYYEAYSRQNPSRLALDDDLAAQLWSLSSEWVGLPSDDEEPAVTEI